MESNPERTPKKIQNGDEAARNLIPYYKIVLCFKGTDAGKNKKIYSNETSNK